MGMHCTVIYGKSLGIPLNVLSSVYRECSLHTEYWLQTACYVETVHYIYRIFITYITVFDVENTHYILNFHYRHKAYDIDNVHYSYNVQFLHTVYYKTVE